MDEVSRTESVYEGESDAFVEKYQTESVADLYGERFFDALSGPCVLDVGCGPGADTAVFSDRGLDVVGFDRTGSFLQAAREAVPEGRYVRGDMRDLPFASGHFDGLWASASLLHVPREAVPATIREFRRVLADDGVALVTLKRGTESGYAEDGRYFERYTVEEVRTLFAENGFDAVAVEAKPDWLQVLAGETGAAPGSDAR
ncbi:class I SAM-dependent methyltransferase [Haloarchaeobius amylolyticus]|uniref:class I SAM-dependent methyltransferase n=1 Tax=Haloarchaeobius amylolyticus TaxID=1198296 RepID=UPI002270AF26|nr:class I SAM-dependent methyltransferase [Haloarchaeobius amylolyticus]